MTRHIARLNNDCSIPSSDVIEGLLHLIRQVLSYSLDSDEDDPIELPPKTDSLVYDTSVVKEYLRNNFFEKIYVNTGDPDRLEASIPLNKFILYHGPIGAGKTTSIRKIIYENRLSKSHLYLYFDIRRCHEIFEDPLDENSEKITKNVRLFRKHVYQFLYEQICNKNPAIKTKFSIFRFSFAPVFRGAFNEFMIKHPSILPTNVLLDSNDSPSLLELFNMCYEFLLKEDNLDDLLRILNLVNSEPNTFDPVKESSQMFHFSRQVLRKTPVLFIDNVDAQPTNIQRIILISGIEISDSPNSIPVIAALRSTNLSRLEHFDHEGAITLCIEHVLPEHSITRDRIKRIQELNVQHLGEMLTNRIELLYDLLEKRKLGFLKRAINEIMQQIVKESTRSSYEKYRERFRNHFEKIRNSYVHEDILKFCNYNLRAILVEYYGFIATHLYDCTINNLYLPKYERVDGEIINRSLRNYFFRWVTLDLYRFADPLEKTKPRSHNIFDENHLLLNEEAEAAKDDRSIRFLKLKILEFLSKQSEQKVKYIELRKVFASFSVSAHELYETLLLLERGYSNRILMGLIRIERRNMQPEISDETTIGLTHAGNFFLEKLSVSIEYMLWMGLYVDVEQNFRMPKRYSVITQEKEKLEFVIQFLKYLIDEFGVEFGNVHDARYKRRFKLTRGYYLERVFDSIFNYRSRYGNRPGEGFAETWEKYINEFEKLRKIIASNKFL